MSKTWFPDLIGPSQVAAVDNGYAAIGIRNKVLRFVSDGTVVQDNPLKRRTDVYLPDETLSVVTFTTTQTTGEWVPSDDNLVLAGLVRLSATTANTPLTGLHSASSPVRLVKFIANVGSVNILIRRPTSPSGSTRYFDSENVTLQPNQTVRVAYDTVDGAYKLKGAVIAGPTTSNIVFNSDPVTHLGDNILNPSD